jgi:hypothetical protein
VADKIERSGFSMKAKLNATAVAAVVCLTLIAPACGLAATYSPGEAAAHIGETATVEGIVSSTHLDDRSGEGFINMGALYPKQAFVGFVPPSAINRIGELRRYDGKTVGITGVIRDYKGRPEIIITGLQQIQLR